MAVEGVPGEFTQRAAEPDLDVADALPCVGEIHAVRLIDRNSLNLVPDVRAEREERHGGARAIGVRAVARVAWCPSAARGRVHKAGSANPRESP